MADWFTPSFTPAENANGDPPALANREYLDVVFDGLVDVRGIKIQGMPPIDIGQDGVTPNLLNVWSVVQTFEIWYNDGKKWYSFKTGEKTPTPITTLVTDPTDFSAIQKFNTGLLDDFNSIAEIKADTSFNHFLAHEVRIVFDSFFGNVLATKLGITVNDEANAICPKK